MSSMASLIARASVYPTVLQDLSAVTDEQNYSKNAPKFTSLPFPIPFELGPLNPAMGLGSAVISPSGV